MKYILKSVEESIEMIKNDKLKIELELHDLLQEQEELKSNYSASQVTIQDLNESVLTTKTNGEKSVRNILGNVIESSKQILNNFIIAAEEPNAIEPKTYFFESFKNMSNELNKLQINYMKYIENNNDVDELTKNIITFGYLTKNFYHQGLLICNRMPDIEIGDSKL